MKFSIENLDPKNDQHLKALCKWDNDTEINHLSSLRRTKAPLPVKTVADIRQQLMGSKNKDKVTFMLKHDDLFVGSFSLWLDPDHTTKKIKGTSWLGIVIGEKEYWGSGVAQFAMKVFEEESIKRGAIRAELGVFEFNTRARQFYKKLGYTEFSSVKDLTFWDGRFWNDIRMEKNLDERPA